jgi:hypothetical protein
MAYAEEAGLKYLWILALMGLVASHGFAQAQGWEKRTYEQALKDPKKTVVDYFLLCPGIAMDDDGRFSWGLMDGGDPAWFPGFFEGKKKLLHAGYKARELSVDSVVVDIPDAYISISGVNFSKRYSLTFVFFDRQGKRDIPAFSYIEQGDVGEKNFHTYGFYEQDPAGQVDFAHTGWKYLSDALLPKIWLSDLDTGPKKPDSYYPEVEWAYVLPQKGTTVLAVPKMTDRMVESRFKGSDYKKVQAFSNRVIELRWDRNQGQFTKGAVRVGAEAPAPVSPGFAQAQPWDSRTYDEALNDPKKTVVDYFLLCPNIGLDSDGLFNVHDNLAPSRDAFEDRKFLLHKEFSTKGLSLKTVVVDIANGYIDISGDQGGAFDLTFVYFDRQGKSGIPAYGFYSDWDMDGASYDCTFFEMDGMNVWTPVNSKILPALSLSDLEKGQQMNHGPYPDVGWSFTLPRKGTTVIASPTSASAPADKQVEQLLHRTLELLWDNTQGLFKKGAVVLPSASPAGK